MANIIINTSNVYTEIDPNYKSMSITLVAVARDDIAKLEKETKASRIKRSVISWLNWGDEEGIEYERGYRRRAKKSKEFSSSVMYELQIMWEFQRGNDRTREVSIRTHAMSLEEAQEEKQKITMQLARQSTTLKLVQHYLDDPTMVAVGLLGDECEKEIAAVIHRYYKEKER